MPRKKASSNGFWTFFNEFKTTQNTQDRKELLDLADEAWRSMTAEEKLKYSGKKNTNESKEVPLTVLQRQQIEATNRKALMLEEISNELLIAKKYKNLPRLEFCLIHINNLCVDHENKRAYPCEVAIACFSLEDGVSKVFHCQIDSGQLPKGYLGEAKLVSEQTHKLPWDVSYDNQEVVFRDVLDFLRQISRNPRELPKLYAISDNDLELIKYIFDNWCYMFGQNVDIEVYNAQLLYTLLYKNTKEESLCPSESIGCRDFTQDIHQFAQGICCEYHEQTGSPVYCSRSIAIRYAYIICETCSARLGIELKPGKHVPYNLSRGIATKNTTSSKVNNIEIDDDAISTVREDSSDVETLVSLGRSTVFVDETESSIGVPECDDFETITRRRRSRPGNSTQSQPAGRNGFVNNVTKPPVTRVASAASSEDLSSNHNEEEEESVLAFVPTPNESGASRTGSSGFSRKPAALPSMMNQSFANLSLQRPDVSNAGRGIRFRGRGSTLPKRGRGTPFHRN